MRTKLRSKISLLFLTIAVLLAIPAIALADVVTNTLEGNTVDTVAEQMPLQVGGANGTTKLYALNTNKSDDTFPDSQNNCNLSGSADLKLNISSSNPSVATVSPSAATLTSCGEASGVTLTVTPIAAGSTTISVSRPSGIAGGSATGTFYLAPATFTVNVSPPPNTPPKVAVAGVTGGALYEKGSVPKATCNVTDTEDGNSSFDATLSSVSGPLASYGLGLQTATCSYTDKGPGTGLTATSSETYNIVDTTAPSIAAHDDVTADAANASGATVTYINPTATDAVDPNPQVNCTPASGSTFGPGDTTVTCTATDAAGNKATSAFKVTVADKTAPVIDSHADITGIQATGPDGATVTYTKPTATDNVDTSVTVNCLPASGTKFKLGDTTVTCSAQDAAGNKATSTFKVTVVDTTGPNITNVPSDITKEATSYAGATVIFTIPTANDAVDGNRTVTCSPDSGSTFSLGLTEVTCSASDASGNTSSAKFNVTVQDTTAPDIATHADITEEATGPDGANVTYTKPTATDNVDTSVTVNCLPASGTKFKLGDTTVECTATDNAGNKATPTTFKVTVKDTTKPELNLPANITEEATGPNGNAVTYSTSASDLVDGSVNVNCSPASGSTFAITTTTVNCSASDTSGNTANGSFTVKVQDTIAPSNIQFVGNINDGNSFLFGDVPAKPTCTATDSGSGLNSAGCVVSGYSTAVGPHTMTATATDKAGNTATREISYTVKPYTLNGFYQPIDMNDTVNTVKNGSTVPVKFELFKGTTELTSTSAVTSIKFNAINCSALSGDPEDAIETVATGGTSLRYDTTAGQFIYNWTTPKGASQVGKCYSLTMTAADSSTITAYFKLK